MLSLQTENTIRRKTRIAVLVSGGGTNLQALIDAGRAGKLPSGEIVLVLSNVPGAYALKRAEKAGIVTAVITRKTAGSAEAFETAILNKLEEAKVDMIILAGFLSILGPAFISRYPDRIINIHPSLIPSFCGKDFYGLKVHEAALKAGVRVTGATVHFVNEIPDGGRIIYQKAVEVLDDDTPKTLQKRVMEEAEWVLLPKAAELVAGRIARGLNETASPEPVPEKNMKIMVIGSGGREHALIKKLRENKNVKEIYALPGNGGIAADAVCVDIKATDLEGCRAFALEKGIDFAVVAPDDPLVLGMVDALEEAGIPCFGPEKKAAIIEGSKVFSKNLMKKYGIPTAAYEVFSDMDQALKYLETAPRPTVIKADGLALGKGVIIAETREEARRAVRTIMEDRKFGASGDQIVIEEFLTGPEVSVLSFTDGKTVVPMVSSMDHKRAHDNDTGLNTGGMGTVAPNPCYTDDIAARCMKEIFLPTINAMNSEGRTFRGCLYFGLMLTEKGPKVIEYNCRFGDPETQVVLPLLDSDLLTIMQACRSGSLSETEVRFRKGAACCVIMASGGYPEAYEKGWPIRFDSEIRGEVFIAGADKKDGELVTSGGRVLGVVCAADDLKTAVENAYTEVKKIHFQNGFCRHDIGQRALKALR